MVNTVGVNDFDQILNAEPDEDGLFIRPVMPLRGLTVYPMLVAPIALQEELAVRGAQTAVDLHQTVIGLGIRDVTIEDIRPEDLYHIGTELALGRLITLPDGYQSALVEGRRRVEIVEIIQTAPEMLACVRILDDITSDDDHLELLTQTLVQMFEQAVELSDMLPDEVVDFVLNTDSPGWLADFIASMLTLSISDRQTVLEMVRLEDRLHYVATLLSRELNVLELKDEINSQIQDEMTRNQREMYLREQLRIIQTELGEDDIFQQDLNMLREQIAEAALPEDVHDKAVKELSRLQMMPPIAPEVGMIRTYLDWLLAIPWMQTSDDNLNINWAKQILDAQHYGLPKIKDRILEHIAVRKLAAEHMKTPILCFVGPPGVGKTSLGKSIAKALGREFVRVSLGGVHDEAEIRGHRRTYIGAMPGRIVQTMRRAGTINPVFMLDEIDKVGADFRGDPAAALLEVLDPEQNNAFSDHYLDMDYDLSKIMFITTANDLYPIPPALLDRMEVIEFPGYTEEEKIQIAREFLIPQQLKAHGLEDAKLRFDTKGLQTIVRGYTYESGVRNFNREIGKVCRKIARLVAEEREYPRRITARKVEELLGPLEFVESRANQDDSVGLATGLAWTSGGGDILTIEVSLLPGKGNLLLTGHLGDVMQESAQAALSYVRSRANDLNVPHDDFENYDVHVHLPEGAVPKDGPSAGVTLATALLSAYTECKVRSDYAMTGEVTLRGRVLPVGGVKEKVLAARRARIKEVLLPEQNLKDIVDIPQEVLDDMTLTFVSNMQEIMDRVLLEAPPGGRMRDGGTTETDN